MRILFDSKQLAFKKPFGTLTPEQSCTLHVHIPSNVRAVGAVCLFNSQDGKPAYEFPMKLAEKQGAYDIWEVTFTLPEPGLSSITSAS